MAVVAVAGQQRPNLRLEEFEPFPFGGVGRLGFTCLGRLYAASHGEQHANGQPESRAACHANPSQVEGTASASGQRTNRYCNRSVTGIQRLVNSSWGCSWSVSDHIYSRHLPF